MTKINLDLQYFSLKVLIRNGWFLSCLCTNPYLLKHFPQGGSRGMFSSGVFHSLSQVEGLN